MGILQLANSLWINVAIIALTLLIVSLMPVIDIKICWRLGINLTHGIGKNPKTDRLILWRQCILTVFFIIYLFAVGYLVFFSRNTGEHYAIHVAPLEDIGNAVRFDCDFAELIGKLFSGDFSGIAETIHVVKPEDIAQALMNIMLFVPLGYLLPYVFKWFRKNISRTIIVCALSSALIENCQLIFKRGCYDFDDLLFNTIGGIIGLQFYRLFAYAVTHPEWRKDLRYLHSYMKNAKKTALYKMASKMDCARVTLNASKEEEIYSFFVDKLGFRLRGQKIDLGSDNSTLLLELGGLVVEFLCSNTEEAFPVRTITLSSEHLNRVRKRLENHNIAVSDYETDPYSKHRSMYIEGPDNLKIVFIEY